MAKLTYIEQQADKLLNLYGGTAMHHNARVLCLERDCDIVREMKLVNPEEAGIRHMLPKARHYLVKLDHVRRPIVHIFKGDVPGEWRRCRCQPRCHHRGCYAQQRDPDRHAQAVSACVCGTPGAGVWLQYTRRRDRIRDPPFRFARSYTRS